MMPSEINKVKSLSSFDSMNIVHMAGVVPSTSRGAIWLIYRGHDSCLLYFLPVLKNWPLDAYLRAEIISAESR